MKRLLFTVTNDLSYDQRMARICTSLSAAGYEVTLIGRKRRNSIPLTRQPFRQKRLFCFFSTGKLFYIEYNIRLFFYLLFSKADLIGVIDLDTILPGFWASRLKGIARVYDAHELFCEMKEIVTRPAVYKIWKYLERNMVPHFKWGYTVNQPIADEFKKMYRVDYEVIRNMPVSYPLNLVPRKEKKIIYQGAVNEGRSFETLIPAMQQIDAPLFIYGDGNFMDAARQLVSRYGLDHKVIFKGMVPPSELREHTRQAYIGLTLFENNGLNNYYSLANRFFDYLQAGLPQVCVDYPAYREINNQYSIAVLIPDLTPGTIAAGVNRLLQDEDLYRQVQKNCVKAREALNWHQEEKKLILFYKKVLNDFE